MAIERMESIENMIWRKVEAQKEYVNKGHILDMLLLPHQEHLLVSL
jgi:hypothetical protein